VDPSSGSSFLLECGIDHAGGDLAMTYVSSFAGCIAACATTSGCVDVSLSGNACYMKSTLGNALSASNIYGAKLITSTSTSTTASATATTSTVTATGTSTATVVGAPLAFGSAAASTSS